MKLLDPDGKTVNGSIDDNGLVIHRKIIENRKELTGWQVVKATDDEIDRLAELYFYNVLWRFLLEKIHGQDQRFRDARGLPLPAIAKRLMMAESTVHEWRAGKYNPSIHTQRAIYELYIAEREIPS